MADFWKELNSDLYVYFYDNLSDDAETKKEVEFLSRFFSKKQKVIELGCGTGRTLIPLLKRKFKVAGLDISKGMLARLREKLAEQELKAELYEKDLLKFKSPAKFDGAILSLRTLNYIIGADNQRKALENIAQILKRGANLMINLCPARPAGFYKSSSGLVKTGTFTGSVSGKKIEMWESWRDSQLEQTHDMVNEFREGNRKCRVRMTMRVIFIQEMKYLLELCGFKLLAIYGDYEKNPYTEKSSDLIFTAMKK